eukprot:c12811_g1_i2.p1 GENE.c12811_g1_i2~~c12811_g1_i2.p1  ORF type:complete len:108 (+),score=32.03 c12811_g1_i2:155-478(+)
MPLQKLKAALQQLKPKEFTEEKLKLMSIDDMREALLKISKPERQAFGKCFIITVLLIIAMVVGLRVMEEIYDPNIEEMESYFRQLGLSNDATDKDIRKAYRQIALKL